MLDQPVRWPRSLDAVDRWLGADGPDGALVCFEPIVPRQADCDAALWQLVRVRADERRREWRGPIGEHLRDLEAIGLLTIDRGGGVVRHPDGTPLDPTAAARLVAGRVGD